MDMKLRGMYIARQLSFKGVSFKIQEIPIEKEYVKMYNDAVSLVRTRLDTATLISNPIRIYIRKTFAQFRIKPPMYIRCSTM